MKMCKNCKHFIHYKNPYGYTGECRFHEKRTKSKVLVAISGTCEDWEEKKDDESPSV